MSILVKASSQADVAAIKAKTDNLPNSGALNDLATIKAVTKNLPNSGSLDDLAAILADTETTLPGILSAMDGKLDTIDDYIDSEVAAIKAQTDKAKWTFMDFWSLPVTTVTIPITGCYVVVSTRRIYNCPEL